MLNEKVFEFIIHMDPNKIGLQVQAIIGIATKLGYQEQVAIVKIRTSKLGVTTRKRLNVPVTRGA